MTRSIGDLVASSVGVTPTPELSFFTLTPESKFIVLASDGIWDRLSNEEVMHLIADSFEK